MKTILKTTMTLAVVALFFTGCETKENLDKIANNLEGLVQTKKAQFALSVEKVL